MGQLEDMAMFVRIVDAGSITKAAEQLGLAKSAVSRRLNRLENALSSQLLSRTTRKSTLTDAGAHYYHRAKNILDAVAALNEQTSGGNTNVDGTLKMTAPLSFGLMHLGGVIHDFAKAHGNLLFQLDFSDRHVDLVEEGYELAIRIGALHDSSLQAKRLTSIRHVLCASPAYLNKTGMPTSPAALIEHEFLQYGLIQHSDLVLTDIQGKRHKVSLNAKMTANNGDFLRDMAIQGHGIVYLPTFLVYCALKSGELKPLLSQYRLPAFHAYAVYPKNRFLSRRCRLLIDFIAARFGDIPYWDRGLSS